MEQTDPPAKVASNDQLGPGAEAGKTMHANAVLRKVLACRLFAVLH
jgi:hypothetical protein